MNTKMLVILSLGLNGIAAVAIAYLVVNRPPHFQAPAAGAASAAVVAPAPAKPKAAAAAAPASEAATRAPVKQFDWRTVESTDYRQYIGNLRTIGCPEETIRDIIIADVNKLFDSRRKELRGAATNKFQFWKTGGNPLGDMLNEERMAKNQELSKEKRELLKSLLGENYADKPDLAGVMNPLEEIMDFLPAGKQGEVLELEQKYGARLLGSMKDAQKGDVNAMRNVLREKDAEMAKMLTPEEYENYQLRLSQTAALMRMRMSEFQPTEQEFRDIFKLQKSFDDQYGIQGMQSSKPEDVQARNAAQKQLDSEIRTTLGEDRFLEYKYSQNFSSSSLGKVADEFQVPRQSALKVFDLQAVASEQAQQVRANTALGPEQRQQALNALRAETEKEVGTLIGKPALDAYIERGTWFKNLNKPPAPGPAAK